MRSVRARDPGVALAVLSSLRVVARKVLSSLKVVARKVLSSLRPVAHKVLSSLKTKHLHEMHRHLQRSQRERTVHDVEVMVKAVKPLKRLEPHLQGHSGQLLQRPTMRCCDLQSPHRRRVLLSCWLLQRPELHRSCLPSLLCLPNLLCLLRSLDLPRSPRSGSLPVATAKAPLPPKQPLRHLKPAPVLAKAAKPPFKPAPDSKRLAKPKPDGGDVAGKAKASVQAAQPQQDGASSAAAVVGGSDAVLAATLPSQPKPSAVVAAGDEVPAALPAQPKTSAVVATGDEVPACSAKARSGCCCRR